MALKSDGLTDIGQGAGKTTNFLVQYEDTLPNQATVIANANALLSVIETEFTVTTGWFNTPGGKFGTGHRQVVNLNLGDTTTPTGISFPGANNSGYGSAINLDAQNIPGTASAAAGRVEMVFMNEWVEILMSLSSGKWNAGDSSGEGLSQYCGIVRFQTGHYNYYGSWVDQWLNKQPRQDWVNQTKATDTDIPSFGCALAFIYYLNTQLGFSINQILAAGASNLATTYRTLTGDAGDPYPFFSALLEHTYPSSGTAAIPGPVVDNPFPLGLLSFWMNKNTFGKDEVQDVINTSGGNWPKAFWLVVEGFSKNSFNALGVAIPAPTGPFAGLSGITISQNPDIDFENAANPQAPQRIRIPFDIQFTSQALTHFPGTGSLTFELDAWLAAGGTKVPGSNTSTQFELLAGADPYFTNIDPAHNNVFYLSQDLRVFTAIPGKNPTPVAGGPTFATDSVAGAYSYIQNLLAWLNNPANHFTDGSNDPFASGVIPQPGNALDGDSSVTPLTVELGGGFPPIFSIYNNYNFALARVRLRGTAGSTGKASGVRVFFRLWSTETADTDYQTGSTYPFTPDGKGLPGSPLVGTDHHTLPCFASGNLNANTDYGTGGANIRDIEIPTVPAGQDSVWAYYGCFLNLYDTGYVIDGKPLQAWLNGTHHCIVAQIADDDAPVIPGASPENTDKLAQRNLQVTRSDNPGPASTHRIPQTFDLRPSGAVGFASRPDELMIDWGGIPVGSVASIYWPQVQASDVVALAAQLYSTHTLSASDSHTLQCKVTGGVTYVPIPAGGTENFAGLFTVDLPTTVVTGQEFDVVVRRITTREDPQINLRTHSMPASLEEDAKGAKLKTGRHPEVKPGQDSVQPRSWRYVVGTFSVKIPVTTAEVMLRPEENTLAIMKWRLLQMAPSSRWYPVLERYITYISARVDGLGGDSKGVLPSPTGVPVKQPGKETEHTYTGKVCKVCFDCFGDFEGFVLADCCGSQTFHCRHRGVEAIVLRACKEGLRLTIHTEGHSHHELRICKLEIQC
ncbi:MAG: hypothetical protein HXX12_00725 [Geothrix sp.]|uniref:hypothetical protein n=1 Tax=Geothrix sp. TaxID=1962974 RepID=UPI001831FB9D|nr:hypothetical protein [Geothrix sp.]NWJ39480.1 hypothetical protein [Geothrix sp.]WIL19297.1 MAG: hypothetical protein QOZ81_001808 [Geothrix sp.]